MLLALEQILEVLPNPVICVDADRVIFHANALARTLFADDLANRDLTICIRHPDVLDAVGAALETGANSVARMRMAGVVPRSFDVHVSTLKGTARSGMLVLLNLYDVTQASDVERMRSDFVSNVSHELRSPLTSLIGFIETLQHAADDDEAARLRFLAIMQGEASRMKRLVDDLLVLSRIETDEYVTPKIAQDLKAIVTQVVDGSSLEARARAIAVAVEVPGDLPNVTGDRDQLVQVFRNLIDNAIKYGRKNSVVRVILNPVSRIPDIGGAGVAVKIVDQGEGIAAHHLPRLTERFYRVDKARSRNVGGTGLGLAIVKHVVNRHQGRMTVKSIVGQGSTFTVYLPSVTKP